MKTSQLLLLILLRDQGKTKFLLKDEIFLSVCMCACVCVCKCVLATVKNCQLNEGSLCAEEMMLRVRECECSVSLVSTF